jgi:hypothetical protein
MEIALDPPHGATGFPIGMPVDELVPEAVSRGRVVITDPGASGALDHMKVDLTTYLGSSSFATTFGLEDGRTLTWLEVHAPRTGQGDGGEELTVTWRGIDVFRTPALELLERIEELGHEVNRDEAPFHYTVPSVPLGFTREAGHEVPPAKDGQPLFMQSVLIAGEGYYDELPDIDFGALGPRPLEHRFEIDPPHGVAGFPFGMPLDELIEATTPLGHVRLEDPGQRRPDVYTKLFVVRPSFTAIFACEDGQNLTAVELWAPEPSEQDRITVELQGIDVFGTPALEVLDLLAARGHELDDTDPDHPRFPDLALGFTRTRGHEVPLASDGRPRYFQAVLTGPAGYYDRPLPPTRLEGGEPWKSRLTRPSAR